MTKTNGIPAEEILGAMEEAKESIRSLILIIKNEMTEEYSLTDEEQFMSFMMAGTISGACTGESLALAGNFAASLMIRDLEKELATVQEKLEQALKAQS